MPSGTKPTPLPMTKALGRLILIQMSAKDLSQVQLAQKTGISQTMLSRTLRGEKDISVSSLISICNVLNIRVEELMAAAAEKVRASEGGTTDAVVIPLPERDN